MYFDALTMAAVADELREKIMGGRLPPLLQLIIEAARELTDSGASSILLVDRKSGDLYFEAATVAKKEEL